MLKTRDQLNQILSKHTGKGIDQIAKDTDRNHWMTSEEAKAYGLVDEIIEKRR
jgi:ATP-dependent Clp protease protease subunit